MAYQNVTTPRMYLNIPEWMASTGNHTISNSHRTLPVSENTDTTLNLLYDEDTAGGLLAVQNKYIAILGHNSTSINVDTYTSPIINGDLDGTTPILPGFSIAKLSGQPTNVSIGEDGGETFGSILLGHYFDFPNSPDLNLTLSYEYDGQKEVTTRGGSTLTNSNYNGVPEWGNGMGAWEIDREYYYAKSGRRVWDISFSFLAAEDVMPDYASLGNTVGDQGESLLQEDTILRAIHFTQGNNIPFIFQADTEYIGVGHLKQDQLAICKFDMNTFQFKQVAHSVYSAKFKIREIW